MLFAMSFGSMPVNNYNTRTWPSFAGCNCAEWANKLLNWFIKFWRIPEIMGFVSHALAYCQLKGTYFLLIVLFWAGFDKVDIADQGKWLPLWVQKILDGNLELKLLSQE